MATPSYAYPTSPVEPGGSARERLHPHNTADSTKLCMYKAMAGATTGDIGQWLTVVEATKPLRRTFLVPFDDDVWALVLAYLYDFAPVGTYTSYPTATDACKGAGKGNTLYISIGSTDPNKSGHAIYAIVGDTCKFYDNEFASDQTKIAPKFQTGFTFLVFSRKSSGAPSHHTLSYKIANMPKAMVESLVLAYAQYDTIHVGRHTVDASKTGDIARRYSARATKAAFSLKTNEALDKQISSWDTAMPKV
jgi:hypothetical protein